MEKINLIKSILQAGLKLADIRADVKALQGVTDSPGNGGTTIASLREKIAAMATLAMVKGWRDDLGTAMQPDSYKSLRTRVSEVIGLPKGDGAGGVMAFIGSGNTLSPPKGSKATFALCGDTVSPVSLSFDNMPAIGRACEAWLDGSGAPTVLGVAFSTLYRWHVAAHKARLAAYTASEARDDAAISAYLRVQPADSPWFGEAGRGRMDVRTFRMACGGGVVLARALTEGAAIIADEAANAEATAMKNKRTMDYQLAVQLVRGKLSDEERTALVEALGVPSGPIPMVRKAKDGRITGGGQPVAEVVAA